MMSGSPWCLPCLGVRQPQAGSRVVLNVGGHRFTTVRSTLTTGRAAGSVLADLVSGPCDQDGSYFLDHDGTQFHFVLNFLRHGPELFVAPETSVALLSLQLEVSPVWRNVSGRIVEVSTSSRYWTRQRMPTVRSGVASSKVLRVSKIIAAVLLNMLYMQRS